jgi:histidinol dehydrogenase
MHDLEIESRPPGSVLGNRHIPMASVGAYVPGGLWVGKYLKTVTYQYATERAGAYSRTHKG